MKLSSISAFIVLVQSVYIIMMDFVLIPGWNENILLDALRPRLTSSVFHGSVGLVFFVANLLQIKWLIFLGAIWFSILLLLELNNWWVPYLFGIYRGEVNTETFIKHYARNFSFLPPIKNHIIIPDGQHVLMELMTLLAGIFSWLSFFYERSASRCA